MAGLRDYPLWKKWLIGIAGWFACFISIMIIASILGPEKGAGLSIFLIISSIFIYPIVFYRLARQEMAMNIQCPNCKYEGPGKYHTPGSSSVELVLWLFFIIPGLIYGTWRGSNRKWICPRCDFQNVIKLGEIRVK